MDLHEMLLSSKIASSGGTGGGGYVGNVILNTEDSPSAHNTLNGIEGLVVSCPNATFVSQDAFNSCTGLKGIDLPNVITIGRDAFLSCSSLVRVDLPVAVAVGEGAFYGCESLHTIILRNTERICDLSVSAVVLTKIVSLDGVPTGEGFIYVPTALFEDYVSSFMGQIIEFGMDSATAEYIARAILRKIEDYPEICG